MIRLVVNVTLGVCVVGAMREVVCFYVCYYRLDIFGDAFKVQKYQLFITRLFSLIIRWYELAVGALQAYIFCFLIRSYYSEYSG